MGLLTALTAPLAAFAASTSTPILLAAGFFAFLTVAVVLNVLKQLLFKNPNEPPVVFHWFPFIGSTVTYGINPYTFFENAREKYGDTFTFILLGTPTTVCLGTTGNDFILNGKLKDVNAEEIYGKLTTPIFGKDVVYDCPNSKLMEQKKFVKFGLTAESLRSYVRLISEECQDYIKRNPILKGGQRGQFDVVETMSELTLYSAARSLQGREVREKLDITFSHMFHDLDQGFSPINFMLPWAPLPHNRKRDIAHDKMVETYTDIINKRRQDGNTNEDKDMIWNLMNCTYKNGTQIPDHEIAHMMIALLMAGQHSSSSTSSWILLNIGAKPELNDELYREQKEVFGDELRPLTYDDLPKLVLHGQVIKETLRLHAPIHSIMRKVKSPMPVNGTPYTIPISHTVLSSPGVTARSSVYFPNPLEWQPHRWDQGADGTNMPDPSADDEEKIDYGYGLVTKGASSPYLPFGAGRHRCIGEQFAYLQLTTILAMFVREFKFSYKAGVKVPETDYTSLFSRPMTPSTMQWERREKA